VSSKGISQLSPLKYILLGNTHPLLIVKEFGSLSNSIFVVTTSNWPLSKCKDLALTYNEALIQW